MTLKTLEFPASERVPAELLLRHSVPAQPWQLASPSPMLRVAGMSPRRPSRREFLIGAGAALVLGAAGCGSEESGQGGETSDSETRKITHSAGTTEVPAQVTQVALTSTTLAQHLWAVGMNPVAMAGDPEFTTAFFEPILDFYPDEVDLSSYEPIGPEGEVNLERLAAIGPELILSFDSDEGIYDRLSQIAPTVQIEFGSNAEWPRVANEVYAAVGRADEGAELRQQYEAALESAPDDAGNVEVAFLRASEDQFTVDGLGSAGAVMADAGYQVFEGPEIGEETPSGTVEASLESLGAVTSDVIAVPVPAQPDSPSQGVEVFEETPLWSTLPAVEAGNVLELPQIIYGGASDLIVPERLSRVTEFISSRGIS